MLTPLPLYQLGLACSPGISRPEEIVDIWEAGDTLHTQLAQVGKLYKLP